MAHDDHYATLGVARTATLEEIRAAYRAAVRRTHPDVANARSTTASDMAKITEAWATLGDPVRRSAYDAQRAATPTMPSTSSVTIDERIAPARFPWKLVGGIILAGIAIILILNAFAQPAEAPGPDGLLGAGSCIVIDSTLAAVEVDCAQSHYGVVRQLNGFDVPCPSDTETIRDRQGMGNACVMPAP
jgi:hypothetical protein